MYEKVINFLKECDRLYYETGASPLSDEEYDFLARKYGHDTLGYNLKNKKVKHLFRMYSLKNVFKEEEEPPFEGGVKTPKLDGSAISLLYVQGELVQGATRGDGEYGKDITDKVLLWGLKGVPKRINSNYPLLQVTGEVIANKEIENSRNYAAGALNLKDETEYRQREIEFIAYGVQRKGYELEGDYVSDMHTLEKAGFTTVLNREYCCGNFPTDGEVCRILSNKEYFTLGFTDKYPRGAYALKSRKDVEIVETKLEDVIWQVGSGGKVTPVAILEPIKIGGAIIKKATLHNAGFIELLDLHYGDRLLVTRAGSVIPKIVGKV